MMSCFAIEGYVINILYAGGPGTNILAFDISVRIRAARKDTFLRTKRKGSR